MKRTRSKSGVAIVEFSFVMVTLTPLLLGTIGFGIRLTQTVQVIQLARDAGRMYARGLDFSQPGNQTTLTTIGADVGLKTDNSSQSVLVLSTVTYVDKALCQSAGKSLDVSGNPINCPNYKSWVFTQRLTIGKASLHSSNLGSPLIGGPTGVTPDATTGKILLSDQVNKTGDVATFTSGNPFVTAATGSWNTMPSGQVLYITEAAFQGFVMPVYDNGGIIYAFNIF